MESITLLLEQFAALIQAPEDVEKLNTAVLQWAVQGRLVPQDTNDEPTSEVLKRIMVEKMRLGVKHEPLPEIGELERLFPLPEGWEWVRFNQIVDFSVGKTPPTKEARYWDENGIYWVSISDMEQYGIVTDTSRKVSELADSNVFRRHISPKGTLLMSFKLTVGKVSILGVDAYHNEAIISIYPYFVVQDYLFRFLPLFAQFGNMKAAIKGATLNSKSLLALPIPLAPLAEQKRIVAKVEAVLGQTRVLAGQMGEVEGKRKATRQTAVRRLVTAVSPDEVATAWEFIAQHFHELYTEPEAVQELKQAILQLAVQGRLVEQDPNDEDTAVLLKRIAQEKQALVAGKKITKLEQVQVISDIEIPHEIPAGWQWVRFAQVTNIATNLVNPGQFPNLPHIAPNNIEKGTGKLLEYQTVFEDGVQSANHYFYEGQLLYSKIRLLYRTPKFVQVVQIGERQQ